MQTTNTGDSAHASSHRWKAPDGAPYYFSLEDVPGISKAVAIHAGKWAGVYFLFFEGKLVYVGQSVNVFSRVENHARVGLMTFDSFRYVLCGEKEMGRLENYYIARFRPMLKNVDIPAGDWMLFTSLVKDLIYCAGIRRNEKQVRADVLDFIFEHHLNSMNGLYWRDDFWRFPRWYARRQKKKTRASSRVMLLQ